MLSYVGLVAFHVLAQAAIGSLLVTADPIQVTVPAQPPHSNVVSQNFLGISFELSYVDEYFGNDTSTIPPIILNYLSSLRSRVGNNPLRIRIGGNSMDSSTYFTNITSPMVQLDGEADNVNDQPVYFGPMLWDVLDKVSSATGGASYLIGLSLLDPNSTNVPLLAGAAQKQLASSLDGFLLGNEPDLYTSHGDRPDIQNYTTAIYMNEFNTVLQHLTNTSDGNILLNRNIGGPSICCQWNLDALLDDGYIKEFSDVLKYISLQHYPQNNCFGSYQYEIPYYTQHANVVQLAAWQESGIDIILANTSSDRPQVIMDEFNSASCGGIPSISDTFAVGTLWTIDYALQMASVGYSAAYLHTRERGVTYNLFTPPDGPDGSAGNWTTNSPFYAMLATAEALRSANGSIVVDLNITNSMVDPNSTVSGYAVYDAANSTVRQLVLFNYANVSSSANSSATFAIPASVFSSDAGTSLEVKYLAAESMATNTNIAWGGQTLANVGDGNLVSSNAQWSHVNSQVTCTNGCSIDVPAPGMAVVFAGQAPTPSSKSGTNGSNTKSSATRAKWAMLIIAFIYGYLMDVVVL